MMKRIFILMLSFFFIFGGDIFSRYCSYNQYGNYHCTNDDGSYEYWNDTTNGNPYSGLPYYHSNGGGGGYYYVVEETSTYSSTLTPNEKCNKEYPGTIYRRSDGWCACFLDPEGISTRDSVKKRCLTDIELNQNCENVYPGTIYRRSDGWCACPHDYQKGKSTWNSVYHCDSHISSSSSNKLINNEKEESSWSFFREVLKIEFFMVILFGLILGPGVIVIWALFGLPILFCSILVGLGIMSDDNTVAMGIITLIWVFLGIIYRDEISKFIFSGKD